MQLVLRNPTSITISYIHLIFVCFKKSVMNYSKLLSGSVWCHTQNGGLVLFGPVVAVTRSCTKEQWDLRRPERCKAAHHPSSSANGLTIVRLTSCFRDILRGCETKRREYLRSFKLRNETLRGCETGGGVDVSSFK